MWREFQLGHGTNFHLAIGYSSYLRFNELAVEDPVRALSFLQTSIAAIVNHDDQEESEEFRRLASTVFTSSQPHTSTDGEGTSCPVMTVG